MARGKKKQLPVSSKTEDIRKTNDVKGTKENKPETNEPPVCHGQATMHGFLSSSKTRSPLRQSPLALLHEDNSTTASVAPKDNFNAGEKGKQDLCHPNTVTIEATCSPSKDEDKSLDAPSLPQQQKKGRITKTKMKKPERSDSQQNRKVTDYYPIRRSSRKSKNELESEEQQLIEELIKNNVEEGLEVKHLEGKGRGVFACKEFQKGQFVVEYHGDLVEMVEAKRREIMYAQDPTTGCYMYYFQFHNKTYCVDATKETDRLGRLINHSKCGNCQTKLHSIQGTPHLILVASRDIRPGEELLYDYGDRSREAIEAHPWLKH